MDEITHKPHILIIEDDLVHQALLRRVFEASQVAYHVTMVDNGIAAMDYLLQRGAYADVEAVVQPDLLVLDLYVPGCDGLTLLRTIQNTPSLSGIWTVVLSNSRRDEDMIAAYQYGAKAYLTKPSDFDQFVAFMDNVLLEMLRQAVSFRRANRELAQMQHQLAHLSRVSLADEVTASIAHQLNQPLTAVMSYAAGCLNRMELERVSPELIEAMELLIGEVRRAGDIVHQLRRFLSKGDLQRQPCSVASIIRGTVQILRQFFIDNRVSVMMPETLSEAMLYVDLTHIQQVIVNILTNAVEAMKDVRYHDRSITIETILAARDVRIVISDTGPGVRHPEKLFQAFSSEKATGMGIGLSVAKRIIEAHQGVIYLDQTYHQGARFVVQLPLMPLAVKAEDRRVIHDEAG